MCWHRRDRRRHPGVLQAQEAPGAARGPGELMEQVGSGWLLLTQSPNSRQNKQSAPSPSGRPSENLENGDLRPGKVKLPSPCPESGQNGSSRLASLLSSLMERHCSALGTPASLLPLYILHANNTQNLKTRQKTQEEIGKAGSRSKSVGPVLDPAFTPRPSHLRQNPWGAWCRGL